jgi:hypothetical protein
MDKPELSLNVVISLPKYNRMWGVDYLLMDSKALMKETGENEYEKITDMFCNIWNSYEYRVLDNLHL